MTDTHHLFTTMIPCWALDYLIRYDWTGLSYEDVEEVDNWEADLIDKGYRIEEYYVDVEEGIHLEMEPAFGTPADCYQVLVYGRMADELDE